MVRKCSTKALRYIILTILFTGCFKVLIHNRKATSTIENKTLCLHFLRIKHGALKAEGYQTIHRPNSNCSYFAMMDNVRIPGEASIQTTQRYMPFKTTHYMQIQFFVPLHTKKDSIIAFYSQEGNGIQRLKLNFGRFSHLQLIWKAYYVADNVILTARRSFLFCQPYSLKKHLQLEVLYCLSLLLHRKMSVILYRMAYWFHANPNKKIWIISDRPEKADDNGEHFLRYLNRIHPEDIKYYFTLEKDSSDYARLKKIASILPYNSIRYKIMFLFADKIISSVINPDTINPFGSNYKYLISLFRFDFVFLQHGITKADVSSYTNRFEKNIDLFITSTPAEYQSILGFQYGGYREENLCLTGMPRYDGLFAIKLSQIKCDRKKPLKRILIAPTWRDKTVRAGNPQMGTIDITNNFIESEWFLFYTNLISDSRLCEYMIEHGYKGHFILHPMFIQYAHLFHSNDVFTVINHYPNYQAEMADSSLLITDYSSIAFDFAYLEKPVIYSQFDFNTIYSVHTQHAGFFDYEQMGFGPVCTTIDQTVNAIINMIDNGCYMDRQFKDRMNDFFIFSDEKQCERVYSAIVNHVHPAINSSIVSQSDDRKQKYHQDL